MPASVFIRTLTIDEAGDVWFTKSTFRPRRVRTERAGRILPGSVSRIRELVEDAAQRPVISTDRFGLQPKHESPPPTYWLYFRKTKYLLYENVYGYGVCTTYERRRPSALALRRLIDDVDNVALKVPPPTSSLGHTPRKDSR